MHPMFNLAIYLGVGTVAGYLGSKTKIPSGVLIGAALAVMLLKYLTGKSWSTPRGYSFFAQVILGVLIALTYTPGMFRNIGVMLAAMFSSTLVLALVGLGLAYLYCRLHVLDFTSAYMATSPGAMSVLVPLAADMDINAICIAQFHLFRVISIALVSPFLVKFFIH